MNSVLFIAAFGVILARAWAVDPVSPPDPKEQLRVLADATRYVINHQLPNFTCFQTTRRLEHFRDDGWRPIETVVERLTYVDQRENYQVIEVNGQPANLSHEQLQGARSSGDFGSILRTIFSPRTGTEFAWQGWITLRGIRMQAYSYRVRAFRSRYHFEIPEESLDLATAYHGTVAIDDNNHFVHRVTLDADGIPPSVPVQNVNFVLDYEYARVGPADHMLPLQFELTLSDGNRSTKNVVDFTSYYSVNDISRINFVSREITHR